MKEKAGNPAELLDNNSSSVVRFYFELCHLKQIYRQGWLQRGIPPERCESVAEHSYGVAMLTMFVSEEHFPELDSLKVLRLALLHDFGEIDAGDLTPSDGVDKVEKSRMERRSVERVCSISPMGDVFIELWKEYEAGETPEAKFVTQIEKLEMALQAAVYEKQGFEGLGDFYESAGKEIVEGELKGMLGEVRRSEKTG
jgi:putative hydrolase of HD superfamily